MDKTARILIVDDDESIRNTLKSILTDEGYIVDLAASGKEALEKTSTSTYNLIFFDIRLPDTTGVDLLSGVPDTVPKTRKIIMTGYPTMQNAIAALNKDADAYLTKPVNIEKLLTTIKEQLQQQENERNFSETKVAEFIESRVKELSTKS